MNEENPLLSLLEDHGPLPFDRAAAADFKPALEQALEQARSRIQSITDQEAEPTFENTVAALEASDEGVDRITSMFYHLLHVETTEELQQLSRELPPILSEYRNDVILNSALYNRLCVVESAQEELSEEQRMVLEDLLSSFRRNGASLSDEDQKKLRTLDQKLSTCAPRFAEHVLKATQSYAFWTSDADLVAPLPESARAVAKEAAEQAGRESEWKFTLDAPSYLAFMTYVEDESLRRQMWTAYASRCVEGEVQNQDLIREILTHRYSRAHLLGYQDHTHYTLERRMVKNLETLQNFFDRLIPVVMPAAQLDLDQLSACKAKEIGTTNLQPWDVAYYTEKLRQEKFDFRQEDVRPWFAYQDVVKILFDLAGNLFDLSFEEVSDIPVPGGEVSSYRVSRTTDGAQVGGLILDPYPRKNKRPGAWMNPLLSQGIWGDRVREPLVGIVANVSPPSENTPSLLTMDEARTLFHEFGHALHELLSRCTYRSVSGTSVRWDFVELPSQLFENWLLEPEFLRTYPTHYQTGDPLPEEMIQKIQDTRTFMKGYQSARQLAFGLLDIAWHTTPPDEIGDDLLSFERRAISPVRLFPDQSGVGFSPSFQHIFSGGYAAGYYSYKWAEVLEADVFEVFKERGLFDHQTSKRLEDEILSRGGTKPPEELFRDFRGRDPDPDALLRRDGLLR